MQSPLSPGRGDPGAALELAYGKLKDFQGPKEILILSDMARRDWDNFDLARMSTLSAEAGIHFMRIGGPERDANFTVKEVKLAEGDLISGVPSRVEVAIMNFSDNQRISPGPTLSRGRKDRPEAC